MSEISLGFEPMFPIWIVFGFVIPALVFLVGLELKKKQKLVAFRIAALILIALAILGLVLQPSFPSAQKRGAILLTPGYDKSKVDSLLKLEGNLKLFRFESAESFPHSQEVKSQLNFDLENVKYILGEGLPSYALERFGKPSFVFLPARLPYGIIELNIPEIFPYRKNLVTGIFNAQYKTKLKLVGAAGTEDSTWIEPGKKTFSLSLTPKQAGLFVYQLESEDSLEQRKIEQLPIEVKSKVGLSILCLQDFPTSEFRHLKNFLAEMGHSVVVRSRTSKNNFTEEFMNTPKIVLKSVSSDLLGRFDLVLLNVKMLETMSPLEKSNLEQAVRNGLGLLVFYDGFSKKNEFYSVSGKRISIDTAHIQIGSKNYTLSALPLEVMDGGESKSIFRNKKRVLAGFRFLGVGKIGFQLLQETFRLRQQGYGTDYATIWASLIEKIARRQSSDFEIMMNTVYPYYTDEPIPFSVVTTGKTPVIFSDEIKIPLQEDVIIDDYWHGKTWAGAVGWHQLRAVDSTSRHYFVHTPHSWKSYRAAYSIKQTFVASKKISTKIERVLNERIRVSKVIFYLIFLFAGGFLWLAPKI